MKLLIGKRRRFPRSLAGATRSEGHERSRGQSVVEFALVFPLLMFIFLGILDLSRVFTSQMVVESAAREAADFGSFNSKRWIDPNVAGTTAAMIERACVASRNLEGYVGTATTCTNPSVTISLVNQNMSPANKCGDPARPQGPCLVKVDMEYDFDLIIDFGLDFLGTRLGLPDHLSFARSSIFAVSDFSVDQP